MIENESPLVKSAGITNTEPRVAPALISVSALYFIQFEQVILLIRIYLITYFNKVTVEFPIVKISSPAVLIEFDAILIEK